MQLPHAPKLILKHHAGWSLRRLPNKARKTVPYQSRIPGGCSKAPFPISHEIIWNASFLPGPTSRGKMVEVAFDIATRAPALMRAWTSSDTAAWRRQEHFGCQSSDMTASYVSDRPRASTTSGWFRFKSLNAVSPCWLRMLRSAPAATRVAKISGF